MTPAIPRELQALTVYGARIPKAFADRQKALEWAEANGATFPGCRVVQLTTRGPRTIWRHDPAAPQETQP